METSRKNPFGWTLARFEAWAGDHGHKPYRGRQAAQWLFEKGETDPTAMSTLPADLRLSLAAEHPPLLPGIIRSRESSDGTRKLLLEMEDGERAEMVLIPEGKRTTLCFSTQVGCPIGCLFCRTGRGGLVRNLEIHEMVGQVVLARKLLGESRAGTLPDSRRKLTNLVVMGMGEPLLNFERLSTALEIITAPWGLGLPERRVTLSTAGVVPRLAELRRRFPALNIAVSLNAPDQDLRLRLMPGTGAWPLDPLLESIKRLPGRSRHPVTFEYVLLGGVNDSPAQARRLGALLKDRLGGKIMQVNLIAWNQVAGSAFLPPAPGAVEVFASILEKSGVKVIRRRSRGADIEAACGQLAGKGEGPE